MANKNAAKQRSKTPQSKGTKQKSTMVSNCVITMQAFDAKSVETLSALADAISTNAEAALAMAELMKGQNITQTAVNIEAGGKNK